MRAALLLGVLVASSCNGRENGKPFVHGGPFTYTESGATFSGNGYFLIATHEPNFAIEVSLLNRPGFRVEFGEVEWLQFLSGALISEGRDAGPLYVDLDTTAEVVLLKRVPFRMAMTLRRFEGTKVVSLEAMLEGPMEVAVCFDPSTNDDESRGCSELYAVSQMETFGADLVVERE